MQFVERYFEVDSLVGIFPDHCCIPAGTHFIGMWDTIRDVPVQENVYTLAHSAYPELLFSHSPPCVGIYRRKERTTLEEGDIRVFAFAFFLRLHAKMFPLARSYITQEPMSEGNTTVILGQKSVEDAGREGESDMTNMTETTIIDNPDMAECQFSVACRARVVGVRTWRCCTDLPICEPCHEVVQWWSKRGINFKCHECLWVEYHNGIPKDEELRNSVDAPDAEEGQPSMCCFSLGCAKRGVGSRQWFCCSLLPICTICYDRANWALSVGITVRCSHCAEMESITADILKHITLCTQEG